MRIYGKVSLEGRTWVIETEPQVALRLKRVFERMNKNQYGKLTLSASATNSRELAWFLQRYPMEMTAADKERLDELTGEHMANEELVGKILGGDYTAPEFELAVQPREYQRISADLAMKTGRLLIADDVGLGKTAQAICTFTDPANLPALVVTLAHLPKQWQREIEKFAPKLRTHVIKKGQPYDVCKGKHGETNLFPDVLITNYHKLAGWAETLHGVVKTVVYDEVQELRRSESGKYGAASHISEGASLRVGLSATPIYNYGGEIYNVISSLEPGVLGQKDEFMREWCDSYMTDRPKIRDPKAFGSFLREQGLMIRRTRSEVGRELEALTKIPQAIEADPEALSRIEDSAAELAKIILSQNTLKKGVKMQASEQLSNLVRQATGIAKAPYVADFVRMIAEADEPILLYAWHREVYSILSAKLADLNPVMYTGSESANQKQEAKEKFLSGEAKVLMMSLRAGAGLDGLQHHCRTVVFGELDWSPGVHDQCLSDDTEILTRRGFVSRIELADTDYVAAFDTATEEICWLPILRRVHRRLGSEKMYSLTTSGVDLRVTAGHRMVFRDAKRPDFGWQFKTAEDLSKRTQPYQIPVAGRETAPGVSLTDDQIRLIGWFVTDGHLNYKSRQLTITQAESSPFNNAIKACLEGCKLRWSVSRSVRDTQFKKESVILRYNIPKFGGRTAPGGGWMQLEPYLDKNLSPLLEAMTSYQLGVFLEAVHMGDGNKQRNQSWTQRSYHIGTGLKTFADRLQSLCVRRGWRANISQRKTPTGKPHWTIHIKESDARSCGGTSNRDRQILKICESSPDEYVWCVENDLGTLIVRRNGKTAVVGNCIGRVHRDGQTDPVMAYFLLSDYGSDPVMSDVLGVKRSQMSGIRDPNAELIETSQASDHDLKKLAESFLRQRGLEVSEPSNLANIIQLRPNKDEQPDV